VVNGKGGVGKTSLTANLAGLYAAAGYRTLAIDLDPQGNLGDDLGYLGAGLSDNGAELVDALRARRAYRPLRDVRPGLDVLAGGPVLSELNSATSTVVTSAPTPCWPSPAAWRRSPTTTT
jgi:chromosome partitioning protein